MAAEYKQLEQKLFRVYEKISLEETISSTEQGAKWAAIEALDLMGKMLVRDWKGIPKDLHGRPLNSLDIAELNQIPNCKMFAENNFAGVILETPPSPRNKTIHYFKAGRVSMFNNHSEPQALLEALEKLEEELKNRTAEEIRAWLGEGYPFRLAGETLKPDPRLGEYPKILANKKLIQKLIVYLYTTRQPCKDPQNQQGCETELIRILNREKSYIYYSIQRDINRRSYPPDTGNQITKIAIAA